MLGVAVQLDLRDAFLESLGHTVGECGDVLLVVGHFGDCDVTGGSETYAESWGERSGAHTAFLAASVDDGADANAGLAADVESADSFGSVTDSKQVAKMNKNGSGWCGGGGSCVRGGC